MDSDEREIFDYLQTWGNDYVSAKEVCRRASTKKRYHEDPDWAKPILQIMDERGLIERDAVGRYRIKPQPKNKHDARWISPAIAEILKEGGVNLDEKNATEPGPEDHEQS
jgi:hypothetical protein